MAVDFPWDYKTHFDLNPAYKQSDIDELKKWVASEDSSSVIPNNVSDKLLLCFYSACSLKMEDTKKCIKIFYSCRDKAPEFFDDRDLNLPALLDSSQYLEYAIMSEKSQEGYPIVYHGISNYAPENYHFCNAVKMLLMTMEMCAYEHGPSEGVVLLFDMRGVKLGHLTRVSMTSLPKFFNFIQEGMPLKIKKIYIMNAVSFFDKVLMLLKPFMKKELIELLHLFPPDADYAAFHKTELPSKCLPKHYDGDQPDSPTLNKDNNKKLLTLKPYFDDDEKQRYTFSKKSKKRAKVERGFQDLCID